MLSEVKQLNFPIPSGVLADVLTPFRLSEVVYECDTNDLYFESSGEIVANDARNNRLILRNENFTFHVDSYSFKKIAYGSHVISLFSNDAQLMIVFDDTEACDKIVSFLKKHGYILGE